jgi:hypothetical protein
MKDAIYRLWVEVWHNLKILAKIVFIFVMLTALCCLCHFFFLAGYYAREAEYGTIESLEQRGLISE